MRECHAVPLGVLGGGNGGRMGDGVGSGGKFGGVTPVGDEILWFRTLSRNRDREVHNSFDMSSVELFSFGMTDTVSIQIPEIGQRQQLFVEPFTLLGAWRRTDDGKASQ